MPSRYTAALEEVSSFLKLREQHYLALAKKTQEQLVLFKERTEFRDAIYRIYSRADKQSRGAPLKSPEKVAQKLIELRAKIDPKARPSQVYDIVGITVVSYYESQRDLLVKGLQQPNVLGQIRVFDCEPKDEHGYYAVHFKIESIGEPPLADLIGELQVKTLFHDGWGTKNHDLIYKPPIALSAEVRAQAKVLGEAVQVVERQTDILRGLIEREVNREKIRRKAAQESLMAVMTNPKYPGHDRRASELATKIHAEIDHLRICGGSDSRLNDIFNEWRKLLNDSGPNRAACRVITLLAGVREAQDLTNIAFQTIEEWINASKGQEKASPLLFGALAHYLFGSFHQAVVEGRKALEYARQHGVNVESALSNLCYYLAEYYFYERHRLGEPQCQQILDELATLKPELLKLGPKPNMQIKPSIMDTLGALAIVTGKDSSEVREGWNLCRRALKSVDPSSVEYPAREAYYLLHEQRACQRLLD